MLFLPKCSIFEKAVNFEMVRRSIMSQAKVDKYKEAKKNRKKIMAKEKRQRVAAYIAGCVVAVVIVGWAGYSGYRVYENNKPVETIYANLDAISDYMTSLNAEE